MSVEHAENLITIELPYDALSGIAETPEAVAKEVRLAAAIEWYREGRVSQDEGAGIAGLSRLDFGGILDAKLRPLQAVHDRAGHAMGAGLEENAGGTRPTREDSEGTSNLDEGNPFVSELAEVRYQRLGRWKGPDASAEAQTESRRFWRGSGRAGICWVIARLRDESHDDRLRGAATMLADLGMATMGPILETLRGEPTADQALALLWALGWLGDRQETQDTRVELILVRYLCDEVPELREAAVRALRVIPLHHAKAWLTRRLRDESDREVRLTIEDELELSSAVEEQSCIS